MKDLNSIRPDPGYPEIEGKLFKVLCEITPDFETADELIRLGADVNVEGKDAEYNLLSELIQDRTQAVFDSVRCKRTSKCTEIECKECDQGWMWDKAFNKCYDGTLSVIEFFLSNGFDVNRNDGLCGAQCLWELTLSLPSKHLIDATRILFDAGAQNKSISLREDGSTAWSFIGTEGSCQSVVYGDNHLANIYEAAWQMHFNKEQGRLYGGIHSYEEAIGKTIIGVLADRAESGETFYTQGGPGPMLGNCFDCNLYLILDDGVLVTSECIELWVDNNAPYSESIDVSKRFRRIIGTQIEDISFEYDNVTKKSADYGRPVADLKMSNGRTLRFFYNFREVNGKKETAYYNIIKKSNE